MLLKKDYNAPNLPLLLAVFSFISPE